MKNLLLISITAAGLLLNGLFKSAYSIPSAGMCMVKDINQEIESNPADLGITSRIPSSYFEVNMLSENEPAHESLFGPARKIRANPDDLKPDVHPRLVFGKAEWSALLKRYADPRFFHKQGTWSSYVRHFTIRKGPSSSIISVLAKMETTGETDAYKSRPFEKDSADFEKYRLGLHSLATKVLLMNPLGSISFFLCTLWSGVSDEMNEKFLPSDIEKTCINAMVAWSKILLAHRTYYCNPGCPPSRNDAARTYLWNKNMQWQMHHDYFSAGSGLAFSYDILYDRMSIDSRRYVRSALALLVLDRSVWGTCETSTRECPNAAKDPHRIVSNWALYHSNLFLTNLAIEGDTDFDAYTQNVLHMHSARTGFNTKLHARFLAVIKSYLNHGFYPDGSTIEDGYSYFVAFREGSLGLIAAQRRGINVLDTPRFRNIIHNAAQMFEPWQCGRLIGHASGGGINYNSFIGLFYYIYPEGQLPAMLWRQRFGSYHASVPCRTEWWQTITQLAFLGGEHRTKAESPQGLNNETKAKFPLSFYSKRRGLLIARNDHSEKSTYIHFDPRPDAFFPGHDNADRGTITYTALRQTWLDDLDWSSNLDSRKHSLLHIDGLAQGEKAPSVKMIRLSDKDDILIAVADLTYAYNVQWAPGWNYNRPTVRNVKVYDDVHTAPQHVPVRFTEREFKSPWDLGWPSDDKANDLGFNNMTTLHGREDIGFRGFWNWKRSYRTHALKHVIRSVCLIRSQKNLGTFLYVDVAHTGDTRIHSFEEYLILQADVSVATYSRCAGSLCIIGLRNPSGAGVDVHVLGLGQARFRVEAFGSGRRVVVRTDGEKEEMWVAFHPLGYGRFLLQREDGGVVVGVGREKFRFRIGEDGGIVRKGEVKIGPMVAQSIGMDKVIVFKEKQLEKSEHLFLHKTNADFQIVLRIVSGSEKGHRDLLVTCGKETTTRTSLAIYECGEGEVAKRRYRERECTLLEESGNNHACYLQSGKHWWEGDLMGGREYFVAVSVWRVLNAEVKVGIEHLLA